MPILDVDQAKSVIVVKSSMGHLVNDSRMAAVLAGEKTGAPVPWAAGGDDLALVLRRLAARPGEMPESAAPGVSGRNSLLPTSRYGILDSPVEPR